MLLSSIVSWPWLPSPRGSAKTLPLLPTPLHLLTWKGQVFRWIDDCAAAFSLCSASSEAPVVSYTDPKKTLIVDMDASNMSLGVILSQEGEHGKQVITYFSRSFSKPDNNYYRQSFILQIDYALLTWLLNSMEPEGQLARWMEN